jgi:hypothetical protein
VEVLAHHEHYDRHHDPKWPDPFDSPSAPCAARDGDRIVVSVQTKLLWIDARRGNLLRESAPPIVTNECAMALAARGSESVLLFAGTERTSLPPTSKLVLYALSEDGQTLSATRAPSEGQASFIDLAVGGHTVFVHRADDWGHGGPVHAFDLGSLVEKNAYAIGGCIGFYADERGVLAVGDRRAAWRLSAGSPPAPTLRPGASAQMEGCPDVRAPLPVALRGGFSAAIDYARQGAGCGEREGVNVRDEGGRVVARRPLPAGSWRFASIVLPWDDGLRVVAQRSDMVGFQIWRVPVDFAAR